MRLLLDTHVVLWELAGAHRLGPQAREVIARSGELNFSVVSFAEIGVKASVGKLVVPPGIADHIRDAGLRILGLEPEHALAVADLPVHHRDPFDRLLIAQARGSDLTLVTADERIRAYDVPLVDALR